MDGRNYMEALPGEVLEIGKPKEATPELELQGQLFSGYKVVHSHTHNVKDGTLLSVLLWREDE